MVAASFQNKTYETKLQKILEPDHQSAPTAKIQRRRSVSR